MEKRIHFGPATGPAVAETDSFDVTQGKWAVQSSNILLTTKFTSPCFRLLFINIDWIFLIEYYSSCCYHISQSYHNINGYPLCCPRTEVFWFWWGALLRQYRNIIRPMILFMTWQYNIYTHTVQYHTVQYCVIHCTVLWVYGTVRCSTILYDTVLYYSTDNTVWYSPPLSLPCSSHERQIGMIETAPNLFLCCLLLVSYRTVLYVMTFMIQYRTVQYCDQECVTIKFPIVMSSPKDEKSSWYYEKTFLPPLDEKNMEESKYSMLAWRSQVSLNLLFLTHSNWSLLFDARKTCRSGDFCQACSSVTWDTVLDIHVHLRLWEVSCWCCQNLTTSAIKLPTAEYFILYWLILRKRFWHPWALFYET